jgi:hypothetical protein
MLKATALAWVLADMILRKIFSVYYVRQCWKFGQSQLQRLVRRRRIFPTNSIEDFQNSSFCSVANGLMKGMSSGYHACSNVLYLLMHPTNTSFRVMTLSLECNMQGIVEYIISYFILVWSVTSVQSVQG